MADHIYSLQTPPHRPHLGFFLIIAAAFVLTANSGFVKLAGLNHLTLLDTALARFGISTLIYLPYFLREKDSLKIFSRPLLWFRAIIGFLAILFHYYATLTIELGNATLLNLTSPLFTLLLAPVFLRESISRRQVGLIFTAFVGVLLIMPFDQNHSDMWGALSGLLSGLCAAIAYMAIRTLHRELSFIAISFSYSFISLLICVIWAVMVGYDARPLLDHFSIFLGIGLLGTAYQGFYTLGLRYAEASRLAPILYASVVLSFIAGWIFFGESVQLIEGVGSLLIVASILFLHLKSQSFPDTHQTPRAGLRKSHPGSPSL